MLKTVNSVLRKGGLALAVALAIGAAPSPSMAADDFPNKPVRIILAFGTGGVSDIVSRLLAERLEEKFGVRFIVDNKPGAGGTLAAQTALTGDNEGYTLLNIGNSGTIKQTLFPNLPFNQITDFDPVAPIANFGLVVVTGPDSGIESIGDLVEKAKSEPVNLGTVVVGSTQHLSALLFNQVAGIEATVVPFKDSPELMGAVARGEVDAAFEIVAGAKSAIETGQVKLLATTGAERSKVFPDAPTVEEAGVAPFEVGSWNAYAAPAGIPPEHAKLLNDEIQKIMQDPEIVEKMVSFGMEPYYGTPEDVTTRQQEDTERWAKIIEDAGIPIQN